MRPLCGLFKGSIKRATRVLKRALEGFFKYGLGFSTEGLAFRV